MVPDALLRLAAFGGGDVALKAWEEWSLARDLSALDPAELRLLPAVYGRLRDGGVPDERIAPIVKQMTRSMWIRTRLLMRKTAEVVQLLASHRIESTLLKGAALIASGAQDAQGRPMSDFDLLVHRADAIRAASVLASEGWIADRPIASVFTFRHAVLLKKGDASCDLHWSALWESRHHEGDDRFRTGAESVLLDGVPVRVLRPEHLVLHVIVHGTRAFDESSVRWIGDALAVLRKRDLDWPLFVEEVQFRGMSYPVGEALAFLVETFGVAVPTSVLSTLCKPRVARSRRRLYAPRPDASRDHYFVAFLRAMTDIALRERNPLGFVRNLQHFLRVKRIRHIPFALTKRLARGVRRWVTRAPRLS